MAHWAGILVRHASLKQNYNKMYHKRIEPILIFIYCEIRNSCNEF